MCGLPTRPSLTVFYRGRTDDLKGNTEGQVSTFDKYISEFRKIIFFDVGC